MGASPRIETDREEGEKDPHKSVPTWRKSQ